MLRRKRFIGEFEKEFEFFIFLSGVVLFYVIEHFNFWRQKLVLFAKTRSVQSSIYELIYQIAVRQITLEGL